MKNTFKTLAATAFVTTAAAFMFPSLATASVVTVNINKALPHSGQTGYSIDGDSTVDIFLSEDCCSPNRTYIGGGFAQYQFAWLSQGQVVGSSLAYTNSSDYTPTAPLLPGLNYLAVKNSSIGNYFGYITIDYELPTVSTGGYSQTLTSYTYDNTGASVTVGAAVPEPSSLMLLAGGLIALTARMRKKS